jgi:hypothetical protein
MLTDGSAACTIISTSNAANGTVAMIMSMAITVSGMTA